MDNTQYYGVEEHRLVGGKGDGMRFFEVSNGKVSSEPEVSPTPAPSSEAVVKVSAGFFGG